jgi:hypothetical protein
LCVFIGIVEFADVHIYLCLRNGNANLG